MTKGPFILLLLILCFSFSTVYGQSDIIKTVYFKSNSYSIDKKYYKTLDSIAMKLKLGNISYLKIFGYADKKGSEDFNDVLSKKRANAIFDYLSEKVKIDKTKLYVTWIGESGQDVAYDLHFPSANIQKRCVDIWVSFKRNPLIKKSK